MKKYIALIALVLNTAEATEPSRTLAHLAPSLFISQEYQNHIPPRSNSDTLIKRLSALEATPRLTQEQKTEQVNIRKNLEEILQGKRINRSVLAALFSGFIIFDTAKEQEEKINLLRTEIAKLDAIIASLQTEKTHKAEFEIKIEKLKQEHTKITQKTDFTHIFKHKIITFLFNKNLTLENRIAALSCPICMTHICCQGTVFLSECLHTVCSGCYDHPDNTNESCPRCRNVYKWIYRFARKNRPAITPYLHKYSHETDSTDQEVQTDIIIAPNDTTPHIFPPLTALRR